MALRIGGPRKPAPLFAEDTPQEPIAAEAPVQDTPEEEAAEAPAEDTPAEESQEQGASEGVLDPAIAGYRGPDDGPFMCANCKYFSLHSPNTCAIVSGYIDEGGLCNNFSPAQEKSGGEESPEEMPMEDMSSEAPAEPTPEET